MSKPSLTRNQSFISEAQKRLAPSQFLTFTQVIRKHQHRVLCVPLPSPSPAHTHHVNTEESLEFPSRGGEGVRGPHPRGAGRILTYQSRCRPRGAPRSENPPSSPRAAKSRGAPPPSPPPSDCRPSALRRGARALGTGRLHINRDCGNPCIAVFPGAGESLLGTGSSLPSGSGILSGPLHKCCERLGGGTARFPTCSLKADRFAVSAGGWPCGASCRVRTLN